MRMTDEMLGQKAKELAVGMPEIKIYLNRFFTLARNNPMDISFFMHPRNQSTEVEVGAE